MKCRRCEAEVSEGARFCPECGGELIDTQQLEQRCDGDAAACQGAIICGEGSRTYLRGNFDERLSDWKTGAELGICQAQWLLGRCFEEGFGVERSKVHAVSWHLKAAEAGFAPAQNHIGACYLEGDGVAEDQAEAVQWFGKAAEQDYVPAQSNLAWCYDTASGVEVDEAEAFEWFGKAAEAGDDTAQFNLAVHYEYGSGIEPDSAEALKWYRKAAEQGYERAQDALERLEKRIAEEKQQKAEQAEDAEREFRVACKNALSDGQLEFGDGDRLIDLIEEMQLDEAAAKSIFEEEKNIFLQSQKEQQSKDVEVKFRIACKNALSDGQVTVDERRGLSKLAKSLGLAGEAAKKIFKEEKKLFGQTRTVTLEPQVESKFRQACQEALADGKITDDEKQQLTEMARFFKIPGKTAKELFDDEKKKFLESRKAPASKDAEQQFRKTCKEALEDGKVTHDEKHHLAKLAKSLNMPKDSVKQIFEEEKRIFLKGHLGKHST